MNKNLIVYDVICRILHTIKRGGIPKIEDMNISTEEYIAIVQAMIRKELIKEVFIVTENDGTTSVLMTNAKLTFHGEVFLSQECGKSRK